MHKLPPGLPLLTFQPMPEWNSIVILKVINVYLWREHRKVDLWLAVPATSFMLKQPVSREEEKGYYAVLSVSPTLPTSTSSFSFCPCFPQLTTHLSLASKCQRQLRSLSLRCEENYPGRTAIQIVL